MHALAPFTVLVCVNYIRILRCYCPETVFIAQKRPILNEISPTKPDLKR